MSKFIDNTITLETDNSKCSILPSRGALVYSLIIDGEELLYQDMLGETLLDREKNVRGGIPILFPNAGGLTEVDKSILGYNQPQHGIIRNSEFVITKINKNKVILRYIENDTLKSYNIPYKFELYLTYILNSNSLEIKLNCTNLEKTKDFSISPGFHPYFAIKNFTKDSVNFINRYIQNGFINSFDKFRLDKTQYYDLPKEKLNFKVIDFGNYELSYSDNLNRLWLWTIHDKNFLCIEPVTGDEGNIVREPIVVKSGLSKEISFQIAFKKI